jgi:hypothetical protein
VHLLWSTRPWIFEEKLVSIINGMRTGSAFSSPIGNRVC